MGIDYLETYKSRLGHWGKTPQDKAYKSGILEFRRYLKYNSHTEYGLQVIKNQQDCEPTDISFDGVILTDKEDENRVSQILLVKALEDGGPAIKPGDLIKWNNDVWILYQSTTSSYQPHQKFYMVRCQYYIKWIDKDGNLTGSWIYLVGSKDSKIKDNFRTWHNIITPQPNKYINIIMPHQMMAINTEIMVLDEVWYLVDYDQNSVSGVIFMSFTETNLNLQRDDVSQSIANIDTLPTYTIEVPASLTVPIGEKDIQVPYTILKNGIVQKDFSDMVKYEVSGNLELNHGKINALSHGKGSITVIYRDVRSAAIEVIVTGHEEGNFERMIIGDNEIRMAQSVRYTLSDVENEKDILFEISDEKMATIKWINNPSKPEKTGWYVIANDQNRIGEFDLKAAYEGKEYSKTIQVVHLWKVN